MTKSLHAVAESIRRRDEPVKTLAAALFALIVASSIAIALDLVTVRIAGGGFLRDQTSNGVVVLLITFLWTAASIVVGGYTVARIHDTRYALSTYIVLELILGAGMVAQFWSSAATWYDTVALLFVIPCAVLGAALAPPRGLAWITTPRHLSTGAQKTSANP